MATAGLKEAAGRTVLGTIVPGLGLLGRSRALGIACLLAFFGPLLALVVIALAKLDVLYGLATDPTQLRVLAVGLVAMALAWVAIVVGTWLVNRPRELSAGERALGGALVGVLSLAVSAPLLVAAGNVDVHADMISKVFSGGRSKTRPTLGSGSDVWRDKPRVNILLLGGDSGANRTGLRTDTIMLASIDTTTGDTTLVQIPRNMARMPFPEGSELAKAYPDGYWDGVSGDNLEYMANSIWDNVPSAHPELFTDSDYPGADALKLGISAATGLQVDYFVMANMEGLQKLIDAMGGVRVNVNRRIPVAGNDEGAEPTGWIEPGPDKHLNGYYAMWYGRSRKGATDFDRMARQSCVIQAVIDQANPGNLLRRYEAIAKAGGDMVMTDIPQDVLQPMVELALRVKDAKVRRVMFVNGKDGFNSAHPDYEQVRARVQASLGESSPSGSAAKPSPIAAVSSPTAPSPSQPPSASADASAQATPTATSEDVGDACAYHPEQAEPSPTPDR